MPRPFITLDAETDPFDLALRPNIPKPFIWGLYDGEEFATFRKVSDLIECLDSRRVVAYAHNGGKFDYHLGFLEYLQPFSSVMLINGRLAKFKIGECEYRDSFNIIPVGLRAYKKDDIDYSIMRKENRNRPKNRALIREYLQGDCVYLHEIIKAFYAEFGAHLTQAGACMKYWQEMRGEPAPKTDKVFYDAMKPFYYGGRVQCFRRGIVDERFVVADIKSAYPYAMLHPHPISEDYECIRGSDICGSFRGTDFYTVRCLSKGAFPLRNASTNALTFPVDVFATYHVTGWELIAGIETGTVSNLEVLECRRFSRLESFDEYVNHFFSQRLQAKASGDDARDLLYKLALNSLYGKFGANPEEYEQYEIFQPQYAQCADGVGKRFAGFIGPWALAATPLAEDEQRYYNVATAASITGFVRAYLWKAIRRCKSVLYCDTDSIAAVDVSGLDFGEVLGAWQHEGTFDRAAIAGKKLYAFRHALGPRAGTWKVRSKGVRLTEAEVIRAAQGETISFQTDRPTFSAIRPPSYVDRRIRMTE